MCVCIYKISVGLFQHIRIKSSLPVTVPEGKRKAHPPAPFPLIHIFIFAAHIAVCHIPGELRNTPQPWVRDLGTQALTRRPSFQSVW